MQRHSSSTMTQPSLLLEALHPMWCTLPRALLPASSLALAGSRAPLPRVAGEQLLLPVARPQATLELARLLLIWAPGSTGPMIEIRLHLIHWF
jgi:hypothetical protein